MHVSAVFWGDPDGLRYYYSYATSGFQGGVFIRKGGGEIWLPSK